MKTNQNRQLSYASCTLSTKWYKLLNSSNSEWRYLMVMAVLVIIHSCQSLKPLKWKPDLLIISPTVKPVPSHHLKPHPPPHSFVLLSFSLSLSFCCLSDYCWLFSFFWILCRGGGRVWCHITWPLSSNLQIDPQRDICKCAKPNWKCREGKSHLWTRV